MVSDRARAGTAVAHENFASHGAGIGAAGQQHVQAGVVFRLLRKTEWYCCGHLLVKRLRVGIDAAPRLAQSIGAAEPRQCAAGADAAPQEPSTALDQPWLYPIGLMPRSFRPAAGS